MDTKPFIDAFHEVNSRLIGLVGSLSALRELSGYEVAAIDEQQLLLGSLEILVSNLNLDFVVIHTPAGEAGLKLSATVGWGDMSPIDKQQHLRRVEDYAQARASAVEQQQSVEAVYNHDSCSYLVLPVLANHELIGIFSAGHPHADFFNAEHERSLIIYCNFLGQLIVNNRLLRDMEVKVQERTAQLEQALAEAQLLKTRYEALSVIDELTELHNRRFFFPEARAAIARALRYHEQFSILMLDVDNFKSINDRYGHSIGDEVLKRIARMLQEQAREADIIARFGGEEFVLALPQTDEAGALILAERIRKVAESRHFINEDQQFRVTISAGVAGLPHDAETDNRKLLENLLQQADTALYFSKDNGRNQVNQYSAIACRV